VIPALMWLWKRLNKQVVWSLITAKCYARAEVRAMRFIPE
jgi:hypothetical protein